MTDLRNGTGRIHGRFNYILTRGLLVLYRTSVTYFYEVIMNSFFWGGRGGGIPFILGTGRIHRVHYDGRGFPGARDNGTVSSMLHPFGATTSFIAVNVKHKCYLLNRN